VKCSGEKACAADTREQKNKQSKQLRRQGKLLGGQGKYFCQGFWNICHENCYNSPHQMPAQGHSVKCQISAEALAQVHIASTSVFFLAFQETLIVMMSTQR